MQKHLLNWMIMFMAATLLVGCGSENKDESAAPDKAAAKAPGSNSAKPARSSKTAEEVAEEARGDLKCPAKIVTSGRPANAPVDDVVGARPGMTLEEVANIVMCSNDLMVVKLGSSRQFRINTFGEQIRQGFTASFAEPYREKSSQEILREAQNQSISSAGNARQAAVQPGQSRWFVGTMGMPGKEIAYSVIREEGYEEGRNPTMASVASALMQKYGAVPTRVQETPLVQVFNWTYAPDGGLMPPDSSLASRCGASSDPNGTVNLIPDCGIAVAATITSMRTNPDLAQSIQVGVLDQGGGYSLLDATQVGLEELDAQRRAKAVEEASRNADKPTL